MTVFYIFSTGLVICSVYLWQRQRGLRREAFIRQLSFPFGLFEKLRQHHPHLSQKDCQLVTQGLRQFFLTHLKSGKKPVSMPSQVADDLWHEFILNTKSYQAFCKQAFGQFFHHTPAAVLRGGALQSNAGLRRCWWYACRDENINPRLSMRLPLLFALDAKLNIANGFHYAADCSGLRKLDDTGGAAVYCGGDFSSSSIDGGIDGLGNNTSDSHSGGWFGGSDGGWFGSGDSGSDGGGCSGGCGGGD